MLKVGLLPWLLHWLIRKLDVKWDVEGLINVPDDDADRHRAGRLLVQPRLPDLAAREHRHARDARHRDGERDAVVPDDDHAAQGAAAGDRIPGDGKRRSSSPRRSATYGMPMVVELGIALDVLVGMLILGVFFFQIREQFDSLDLQHLEKLKRR